jgi:glutamine---fructose-6-phosphate transaminase (isomerizing)
MCGIVGYVGFADASEYLLEGLRRLEYRGYDSSGIATIEEDGEIAVDKAAGRVDELASLLKRGEHKGSIGIGHTRWATHGPATDINAHPHVGGDTVLALVHNGVIENFRAIKDRLIEKGCEFRSATDTEVVAQLLAYELDKVSDTVLESDDPYAPLITAVQKSLAKLRGTYGLAMVATCRPH